MYAAEGSSCRSLAGASIAMIGNHRTKTFSRLPEEVWSGHESRKIRYKEERPSCFVLTVSRQILRRLDLTSIFSTYRPVILAFGEEKNIPKVPPQNLSASRCIRILGHSSHSPSSSTQPPLNGRPATQAASPAVSYATRAAARPSTSPNAPPSVSTAVGRALRATGSSSRRRPSPTMNSVSSATGHVGARSAPGATTTTLHLLRPADVRLLRRPNCHPRG